MNDRSSMRKGRKPRKRKLYLLRNLSTGVFASETCTRVSPATVPPRRCVALVLAAPSRTCGRLNSGRALLVLRKSNRTIR